MAGFIVRRVLWLIPVLFVVSIITFVLMHLVPGGPWAGERNVTPGVAAAIDRAYHLNDPLWQQYGYWVTDFIRGDFGPSFKYANRSINQIIVEGLPATVAPHRFTGALRDPRTLTSCRHLTRPSRRASARARAEFGDSVWVTNLNADTVSRIDIATITVGDSRPRHATVRDRGAEVTSGSALGDGRWWGSIQRRARSLTRSTSWTVWDIQAVWLNWVAVRKPNTAAGRSGNGAGRDRSISPCLGLRSRDEVGLQISPVIAR